MNETKLHIDVLGSRVNHLFTLYKSKRKDDNVAEGIWEPRIISPIIVCPILLVKKIRNIKQT